MHEEPGDAISSTSPLVTFSKIKSTELDAGAAMAIENVVKTIIPHMLDNEPDGPFISQNSKSIIDAYEKAMSLAL